MATPLIRAGLGGEGALFKGQDSRVCLQAVSSGAEVEVDGPDGGALSLLCCRSVVAKAIK